MQIKHLRPRGRYLGTVPFLPPRLAPVTINIPEPVVGDLQPAQDEPGVSTDDSGMSVVTVVANRDKGLPWWVWAGLAVGGAYYLMNQHEPRRRDNPEIAGGFTVKDLLILGGVGVGAYFIWQLVGAAGKVAGEAGAAVAKGYDVAVNWTSDLFSSWLGSDPTGTSVYHIVTFLDDNSRHAVGANLVGSNGQFAWTGYPPGSQSAVTYQLGKDSSGNWVATPV